MFVTQTFASVRGQTQGQFIAYSIYSRKWDIIYMKFLSRTKHDIWRGRTSNKFYRQLAEQTLLSHKYDLQWKLKSRFNCVTWGKSKKKCIYVMLKNLSKNRNLILVRATLVTERWIFCKSYSPPVPVKQLLK